MDYTINISELERIIREAHEAGYNADIIINGEIYSVRYDK